MKKISLALILFFTANFAYSDALFESDGPLEITLKAPLGEMRDTRDKEIKYPAKLTHAGTTYDIDVSVRGNKRLMKATCKYTPLWLDFDKEQTEGTLFDHQKHTKLVVQCRKGPLNEDYLRAEYLVYKMYSEVAPISFRVRWITANYIEEDGSKRTEPAFLIERKSRLGKRVDMATVEEQKIAYADLDQDTAAVVSLFNYIVANPDFSLVSAMSGSCCHNSKLFQDDNGTYFPVLYDFDSSGVIDARYAAPNPSLKIKKVTDRIYRGYCKHNANLDHAKNVLFGARSKFMSIVNNDPVLSDRYKKKMTKYMDRSFKLVEKDATFQSKIINKCRGEA
jgi:hypothetical protein